MPLKVGEAGAYVRAEARARGEAVSTGERRVRSRVSSSSSREPQLPEDGRLERVKAAASGGRRLQRSYYTGPVHTD